MYKKEVPTPTSDSKVLADIVTIKVRIISGRIHQDMVMITREIKYIFELVNQGQNFVRII